jgi:hypothetical protein
MESRILYNGANMCHSKDCCPIIERQADGTIVVHDPAKPESGRFTMTTDELRAMLGKAPDILSNLSA